MECPLGCTFDWRILGLAIGALLLGLLTLLSLAMNIGGVMMLLRRFKVSLDIQPRADGDGDEPERKPANHSVLATWLFGLFVLSLIAIAVALIASG